MWKVIDYLKSLRFFKLVTIYLRYMIGFAFVFASFIKMKGERFTSIPVTEPIGYFFEAMYQTGPYWKFLGLGQFIAGSLLMTQRFATLGAVVFFPIILNVFMITHAIDFGSGTPVITSLMLLGTLYLLLWDYKKFIILIKQDHHIRLDLTEQVEDKFMTDPVWIITGLTFIFLSALPWIFKGVYIPILFIALIVVGVAAFIYAMIKYRNKKAYMVAEKA